MSDTTVYAARSILTMHPARPRASHVAVRNGRILGVGSLADLAGWGPHTLDQRFARQVLMPGLVEGHCHLMAGTLWRHVYCGHFDAVARAVALAAKGSERLRLGRIKVVADGSIQGFSARRRWPGYFNGAPNGLWYAAPETMRETYTLGAAHSLGLDGEIGSIECAKRADFCVLDDDPGTAPAEALKTMRPWGTVQGGRAFAA